MGYFFGYDQETHLYNIVNYRCIDIDVGGGEVITEFSMSSIVTSSQRSEMVHHFNLRTRKVNGKEQYLEHNVGAGETLHYSDVGSGMACGYSSVTVSPPHEEYIAPGTYTYITAFGLAFLRKVRWSTRHESSLD